MNCETTIVDTDTLEAHLGDDGWVVFDCRYTPEHPSRGEAHYRQQHLPGARYAHLDRHLSGIPTGANGRHPLPSTADFMRWLGEMGVGAQTQVVAYDDAGGPYAARLWWMLRWVGHACVAVLDGGWPKWVREQRPVTAATPDKRPTRLNGRGSTRFYVDAEELAETLDRLVILDARSPARYAGLHEPQDRIGGHIPGAKNHYFRLNLDDSGCFRPAPLLRQSFLALLGAHPPTEVVHSCGSGVTACHNLLAMEIAGCSGSRLYPGSWSEWCSDRARPVARKAVP